MTIYLTESEIKEREDALILFVAKVDLAKRDGMNGFFIYLKDAILVEEEIERLLDVEEEHDDAMAIAADRRYD